MQYLQGTKELGLIYRGELRHMEVYTDASLSDCTNVLTTCGYIMKLFGDSVDWRTHKQSCVALSTCEAEYVAAASCCSQVIWIQQQLRDYGLFLSNTPIYVDNSAAIAVTKNPVHHPKTKHIGVKYHFTRHWANRKPAHRRSGSIGRPTPNSISSGSCPATRPPRRTRS